MVKKVFFKMSAEDFRPRFKRMCDEFGLMIDRDGADVFGLGNEDNTVIKVTANPAKSDFDILEDDGEVQIKIVMKDYSLIDKINNIFKL